MRPITMNLMATLEAHRVANRPAGVLYTQESIAFQKNDAFGPQLEVIVSKYKELVDAGVGQKAIKGFKELRAEFEGLIKQRLGISVSLVTDSYLAATIPNVFIPHNPIIQDRMRDLYEFLNAEGVQKKLENMKSDAIVGKVNTEKAFVTGWYSQQKAPVFINFLKLFKDYELSVAEVTAIILHELGHDFEAIVFSANVNATNQVIADIVRHIQSDDRGGDVSYVFMKLKEIDKKAHIDIAKALTSGNRVVMNMAMYKLLLGSTRTLMDDITYDRTGFEAMSDQFASRFGYGRALVTGLEKFEDDYSEYKMSENIYKDCLVTLIATAILTLLLSIGLLMPGVAVAGRVIFGLMAWLMGTIFSLVLDSQRVSGADRTYDNIRDRYLRVRLQMVQLIKDTEIDKEAKTAILEDIKILDEVIAEKKVFESPIGKLMLKFSSTDQRADTNIKLQREIEEMLANDIFVSANQLQQKA